MCDWLAGLGIKIAHGSKTHKAPVNNSTTAVNQCARDIKLQVTMAMILVNVSASLFLLLPLGSGISSIMNSGAEH